MDRVDGLGAIGAEAKGAPSIITHSGGFFHINVMN
jgi:hypothetical protein